MQIVKLMLVTLLLLLLIACSKNEVQSVAPFTGVVHQNKSPCNKAVFKNSSWTYHLDGIEVANGDWNDLLKLNFAASSILLESADSLIDPTVIGIEYDIPYVYKATLEQSSTYIATLFAQGYKVTSAEITSRSAEITLTGDIRLYVTEDALRVYSSDLQ